jgi:hypothetical protein
MSARVTPAGTDQLQVPVVVNLKTVNPPEVTLVGEHGVCVTLIENVAADVPEVFVAVTV